MTRGIALALVCAALLLACGAPATGGRAGSAALGAGEGAVPAAGATAASPGGGSPAAPASSPAAGATSGTASAAGAAPPVAPAPAKVNACIPSRGDAILPLFAADDGGYLKQQNVEADTHFFAGGAVDAAFAAGQCDYIFGAGGIGPLLQGVDVVVIAVTTTVPQGQIWARPPLRTLAELKGKQLGSSGAGSLSWRLARYFLQTNGIAPDDEVALIPFGDSSSTYGALTTGRVESALLNSPLTFRARKDGLNLLYEAPPSMQMMNTGLVTSKRYLAANRDVARRMVQAIAEAMTRLKADEAFYGEQFNRFTSQSLEAESLREFWQQASQLYAVPPRGSHEGAVTALTLYAENAGTQNLDALAREWLDMSLVDELFPPGASR
jgi:ABC-type nitrate/sulfonate/bicarbonate transport system substrate-binding protein